MVDCVIFKIYYWWLLQVRTSLTGLTGPPTHPRAVFTIRTTVEKDLQWAVPRHGCQQKGFSFTSSSAGTSTSEKSRPKRQISSTDSPPLHHIHTHLHGDSQTEAFSMPHYQQENLTDNKWESTHRAERKQLHYTNKSAT